MGLTVTGKGGLAVGIREEELRGITRPSLLPDWGGGRGGPWGCLLRS